MFHVLPSGGLLCVFAFLCQDAFVSFPMQFVIKFLQIVIATTASTEAKITPWLMQLDAKDVDIGKPMYNTRLLSLHVCSVNACCEVRNTQYGNPRLTDASMPWGVLLDNGQHCLDRLGGAYHQNVTLEGRRSLLFWCTLYRLVRRQGVCD